MRHGHRLGLINGRQIQKLDEKERRIAAVCEHLERERHNGDTLSKVLRRPEMTFDDLYTLSSSLRAEDIPPEVAEQVQIELKYEGYIDRQRVQIARSRKMEGMRIPADLDYAALKQISNEAKHKLAHIRPRTLGQAGRISGVTPADISVLMVHLAATRAGPHRA